jgi:predicted ArsR family transcriptional regulator
MRPPSAAGRRGRRDEVLAALRSSGRAMTIAELATELGVHVNTVRFHLDGLVRRGQVEPVESTRSGPGRPRGRYRLVAGMDPAGPRRFLMLAEILTRSLATGPAPQQRAVEAGREWGRQLPAPPAGRNPVGHLVAHLADLGFAPEQDSRDRSRIDLRHCPFLELAQTHAAVVCPIHLGLMQGVMETAGAPVAVDRLEPFVEPDLCVAHLAAVVVTP